MSVPFIGSKMEKLLPSTNLFVRIAGALTIINVLIIIMPQIAGGAVELPHAFAERKRLSVIGSQAEVWTAQQPNSPNSWRASPVAICTSNPPPCRPPAHYIETGYNKGQGCADFVNQLVQYDAWEGPNGLSDFNCYAGVLSDDHWYVFDVWYKAAAGKWIIRRDGVQVVTHPLADVGFNSGNMIDCGAEGGGPLGMNIAVECKNMKNKVDTTWNLYNYTIADTAPGYCVFSWFDFEAVGYKC